MSVSQTAPVVAAAQAANESGMRFYEANGFAVIKEETPDQAHHRGHCLDGVSGGGRTVLLADQRLKSI
jgi:hypothetical protein